MVQNTRSSNLLNTEWTVAAQGVEDAFISLENRSSPVLVRIAESTPSAGTDDGHTLTSLDRHITITGLSATQKVYVRAVTGSSKVCIS